MNNQFVIWGGFSVNNATLNRFFALHFVLPFVLAALALTHLIALHDSAGSNNPLGVSANYDRLPFSPYFIFKDLITIFLFILVLALFVFFMPNILGDSENYVMANPMQTPPAIVPEWYLLPFYAILRSIPNKLLGVIAMFSAILILLTMPFTDLSRSRGIQFRPISKIAFFIFAGNFLILMQLGAKHVESPFIEFGQISTVIYFSYFLILVPLISLIENSTLETNNLEINNLEINNLEVSSLKYTEYSSFLDSVNMYFYNIDLFFNKHPILRYIGYTIVAILSVYMNGLGVEYCDSHELPDPNPVYHHTAAESISIARDEIARNEDGLRSLFEELAYASNPNQASKLEESILEHIASTDSWQKELDELLSAQISEGSNNQN